MEMPVPFARVTVTLPQELVEGIDRHERNRSRFVAEAVANELARRRHEGLRRSLSAPHPDALVVAEEGLVEWGASAGEADVGLIDAAKGKPISWRKGKGWSRGGR